MTITQSLYHTFQRYRTLQTDHIMVLPIVILMPHSSCNCRCVMCDIWKDNKNLKQLSENDIQYLLQSFKKLGTRQVVMSGGEALMHPNFFRFCEIINRQNIKVTLLSTGITLERNAEQIVSHVGELIVSLDGDEVTHNHIRNIPDAFKKLKQGIKKIRAIDKNFKITGRSVIHKSNFRQWTNIIEAAKEIELNQISFLPADISSHAFNREVLWSEQRQHEILPDENELAGLKNVLDEICVKYKSDFDSGFIAESPVKLQKIYQYYAAFFNLNPFPYKKCNAPWVSAVVEADGTVRPCFFHPPSGNIHDQPLDKILNSNEALDFRKKLDIKTDSTCIKCVCYLNLSPGTKLN